MRSFWRSALLLGGDLWASLLLPFYRQAQQLLRRLEWAGFEGNQACRLGQSLWGLHVFAPGRHMLPFQGPFFLPLQGVLEISYERSGELLTLEKGLENNLLQISTH